MTVIISDPPIVFFSGRFHLPQCRNGENLPQFPSIFKMLIFPPQNFRRPSGGDFFLNNQTKTLHFNLDLVSKSPAGAIFFLKRASGARFPLFFVLNFHFERLRRLDFLNFGGAYGAQNFLNFPQFCRNFLNFPDATTGRKKTIF